MEDFATLPSQEAVAAVAAASSSPKWRFIVGVSAVVLPAAVRVMSNWRGLHRSLLMMQLNHHLRKVQRKRAKLALQGIPPRPVSEEFEALESLFRMIPLTTDIQATRSLMRGFPVFTKAERFLEESFGIPHYFPALSLRSHVPAIWVHPLTESSEKHSTKHQRVILYLHGGGYVAGRAADYTHIVARLGRLTSSRMLLVDYCLAPEYILPPDTGRFAPVEEAVSAYQWLLSSGERPEHITICGDSAGGGLSLLTVLRLKELGLPLPRAVVMFSPWLDLSLSRPSWKMNKKDDFLLGVAEPVVGKSKEPLQALITGSRDPIVWSSPTYSPMFALDFSGLPAMYAQVGGSEVLLDEARVVCETAKRQSVDATLKVAPGMCHIFPLFADWVPEGKMALDDAATWLDTKYATVDSGKIANTLKASLAGTFAKAKSTAVM